MNKLANVVYSYRPKNDDELELEVGDKIEVIGIEEEGEYLRLKSRDLYSLFTTCLTYKQKERENKDHLIDSE